jgi:hypothetical protein
MLADVAVESIQAISVPRLDAAPTTIGSRSGRVAKALEVRPVAAATRRAVRRRDSSVRRLHQRFRLLDGLLASIRRYRVEGDALRVR